MTDTADFERMEREGWSNPSIAKGYADRFDQATIEVSKHLALEVRARDGTYALDLCTGHGVVAAELVARGSRVVGLDFSEAMISIAKAAVPEAGFVQGDAMNMQFSDASFDAVTIGFGVPHFPDPERGLSESARVLRTGGRIAYSIWRGKGSNGSFGWLFDAVERFGDPSVTLPAGPDAHMLVDRAVAEPLMATAGFSDVRMVEVESQLKIQSPEHLFDVFDQGAVRAASLLRRQPATQRDVIRDDLAERVKTNGIKDEGGYLVPAPSVILTAVRN